MKLETLSRNKMEETDRCLRHDRAEKISFWAVVFN